jgi:hypothetical protein
MTSSPTSLRTTHAFLVHMTFRLTTTTQIAIALMSTLALKRSSTIAQPSAPAQLTPLDTTTRHARLVQLALRLMPTLTCVFVTTRQKTLQGLVTALRISLVHLGTFSMHIRVVLIVRVDPTIQPIQSVPAPTI